MTRELIKMTEHYLAPAFRRSLTEGVPMQAQDQCATESTAPANKDPRTDQPWPRRNEPTQYPSNRDQRRFVECQTDRHLMERAVTKIEKLESRVSQLTRELAIYDNMVLMAKGMQPGNVSKPVEGPQDHSRYSLMFELKDRTYGLAKELEEIIAERKADDAKLLAQADAEARRAEKETFTLKPLVGVGRPGKKGARKK